MTIQEVLLIIRDNAATLRDETLETYYTRDKASGEHTEIPDARSYCYDDDDDDRVICLYKGLKGQRCAVSRLAPEETDWMERSPINGLHNWAIIKPHIRKRLMGEAASHEIADTHHWDHLMKDVIALLQGIHDSPAYLNNTLLMFDNLLDRIPDRTISPVSEPTPP